MTLADAYRRAITAASRSAVASEPEAQLTVPISNLLIGLAAEAGLGTLQLIREAQLAGVRPDFAALLNGRACGWIELKAPGHTLDGSRWRGREGTQWALLRDLDSLLVTDGESVRLYIQGQAVSDAELPGPDVDWDPQPLVALLRLFVSARPSTVRTVTDLAARLAPLTGLLRDRLRACLDEGEPIAVLRAKTAWASSVHEGVSDHGFANDVAQVIAYSLAIAAMSSVADADHDGVITLSEARAALRGNHALLAAALAPVVEAHGFLDVIEPELAAVERLVSAIDRERIARSQDSRGEPWLWFYEDFLARYDPEARRQAGVYYTPVPIVECQVRLAENVLTNRFGIPLGFADTNVVTLDPAAGSGTFPLAVIDHAVKRAMERRGAAGSAMAARNLARNLIAFEVLPGPYAVSHLRVGQRLAEAGAPSTDIVRVYLTDTLDDPEAGVHVAPGLWGDAETLAVERARAARVRAEEPVTVILGNPPYARRNADSGGGWVVHPVQGRSLFTDLLDSARDHGVNFSAQSALYNDYVYFWRWAIWKGLQQRPDAPAVISFVTASSWLNGPGFVGLRELAQKLGDEIWIVDLGGDGRGVTADDNVFSIQTPVAVVTIVRDGATDEHTPATIYYQRIDGSRDEKLQCIDSVQSPDVDRSAWQTVQVPFGDKFTPYSGSEDYRAFPLLTDLFPWQQPGCKLGRTWPISPSESVLRERWRRLVSEPDLTRRAELFSTGSSGRNIHTLVHGLPKLAELDATARHRPIVRYGYRPFDRQWTFDDPRLAKTESPSLWQSQSESQIFLVGLLTRGVGPGPLLVAYADVPDMHAFRGSYGGKDVIPLYRDGSASRPNVTAGLLEFLTDRVGQDVRPEDLAAYVYAIASTPAYQVHFPSELADGGPRVPLTGDPELWARSVALGRELLRLHTYGQRFTPAGTRRAIERPPEIGWVTEVQSLPADDSEIEFNPARQEIKVGSGTISGVSQAVWNYEVSGYAVVRKWLALRTERGIGRAATAAAGTLDRIRPQEWNDAWNDEALELVTVITRTLDIQSEQEVLLSEILTGDLIGADVLPAPTSAERRAPTISDSIELDLGI